MEASSLRDRQGSRNTLNDVALGEQEVAVNIIESKKFWKLDVEFSCKMTSKIYLWNKNVFFYKSSIRMSKVI
jgi:hypothetical protein